MIISLDETQFLQRIVKHLQAGDCVALPTETVYGLAADASNSKAVEKIFTLKGRPADRPISVLLADKMQMNDWAIDIPDIAWKLADQFWPGPLTLILPKASHVSDVLTAHQDTIGLRVPSHPVALAILQAFNGGLAAPSANPFQQNPPTTAQAVVDYFSNDLWIVDGGVANIGVASTIVDCTASPPQILREGIITKKDILSMI